MTVMVWVVVCGVVVVEVVVVCGRGAMLVVVVGHEWW